jgi:hypothetical protein
VASAWLAIIILPRIGRFRRLVVRRMVAFGEWSFGEWSPSGIGRSEIGRSENGRSGIGRSGNGRCTYCNYIEIIFILRPPPICKWQAADLCKNRFVTIYLTLLWGNSLVCYRGKAEAKNWRTYCHRDKLHTQFFLQSGQRVRLSLLQEGEGLKGH